MAGPKPTSRGPKAHKRPLTDLYIRNMKAELKEMFKRWANRRGWTLRYATEYALRKAMGIPNKIDPKLEREGYYDDLDSRGED